MPAPSTRRPQPTKSARQRFGRTSRSPPSPRASGLADPAVLETADSARAIVIRLTPGQSLDDHRVRERAWLMVVEGRASFEAGDQAVEAGPGLLFSFDPGETRSVHSATGARIVLILSDGPGEGHFPVDQV